MGGRSSGSPGPTGVHKWLGEGLPESDSSARSTAPEEEEEGRLGDGGASGSCSWAWTTMLTVVTLRDALKSIGSSGRRGGCRWAAAMALGEVGSRERERATREREHREGVGQVKWQVGGGYLGGGSVEALSTQ